VTENFFTAAYSTSHTLTMNLTYDSILKCVNTSRYYGSYGELYVSGIYPTTT